MLVKIDAVRTIDIGEMTLNLEFEDAKQNQVLKVQRIKQDYKDSNTNRLQSFEETRASDADKVFHWLSFSFLSKNRKQDNLNGMPSWQQVYDGLVAEETA